MSSADISVIIPALNEAASIGRAIRSAAQQSAKEIIVVDGGSGDETVQRARQAGAQVIASAAGRGRQQNAGAAASQGEVLLFLHADNWLAGDCLTQIAQALDQDAGAWGGAFWQRIDAPGRVFRLIEQGDALRVRARGIPFGDQGIFIRRSVFESAGGFPDEPLMEDLLLMKRLRRVAWPLLLPGPLGVSARRWQRHGVVRQTARNWLLQLACAGGCPPRRLAAFYRSHDAGSHNARSPGSQQTDDGAG